MKVQDASRLHAADKTTLGKYTVPLVVLRAMPRPESYKINRQVGANGRNRTACVRKTDLLAR